LLATLGSDPLRPSGKLISFNQITQRRLNRTDGSGNAKSDETKGAKDSIRQMSGERGRRHSQLPTSLSSFPFPIVRRANVLILRPNARSVPKRIPSIRERAILVRRSEKTKGIRSPYIGQFGQKLSNNSRGRREVLREERRIVCLVLSYPQYRISRPAELWDIRVPTVGTRNQYSSTPRLSVGGSDSGGLPGRPYRVSLQSFLTGGHRQRRQLHDLLTIPLGLRHPTKRAFGATDRRFRRVLVALERTSAD